MTQPDKPPPAEGVPDGTAADDPGRMPAEGGAPSADGEQSGGMSAAEIVAHGDTLDIPWESPDPAEPIKYAGSSVKPVATDPADTAYRTAWANHFLYGSAPPEPREEQDGSGGQVPMVPGGSGPAAGGGGATPRVPARPAPGGPAGQRAGVQPKPNNVGPVQPRPG